MDNDDIAELMKERSLAMNTGWVIFCGSMVFITQLGFFQLEAGHVADIWIHSIILKNCEDAFAGILLFSMIGYGFVQSTSSSVWGYNFDYFFLNNVPEVEYAEVFYRSLYAIASTTIVSSCVLERIKNKPYLFVIVFMTTIQFPLLSFWCWSDHGWLKDMGYIDFSGGSVVHIPGGIVGLILIIYLGNRHSVNDGYQKEDHNRRIHSNQVLTSSAIGTFLLWFGWFGFICGSTMNITDHPVMIGRVALNVALCSAAGGVTTLVIVSKNELETIVNGVLMGLVAATGGVHVMQPWAAMVTGIISGVAIVGWKRMIQHFRLDDPLTATGVHIGGGIVAIISTGCFHMEDGLFYGAGWTFFGIQILGCFTIIILSLTMSLLFCFILELTVGLRIDIFSGYLDIEENQNNGTETLNIAITVRTPTTNAWLWHFHKFMEKRLAFEQLDFLVAANHLISKIDRYERKYGIGGNMDEDREEQLLLDRNALIEKYLTAESAFVANVSHQKLEYFKKTKDSLQPFQLKAVLLEVYIEVMRMLQIPFTEWMRGYCRSAMLKRQATGGLKGLRQSLVSRLMGDADDEDSDKSEQTAKYRKVYFLHEDYTVEWRIQKFTVSMETFSRSQSARGKEAKKKNDHDFELQKAQTRSFDALPELKFKVIPSV